MLFQQPSSPQILHIQPCSKGKPLGKFEHFLVAKLPSRYLLTDKALNGTRGTDPNQAKSPISLIFWLFQTFLTEQHHALYNDNNLACIVPVYQRLRRLCSTSSDTVTKRLVWISKRITINNWWNQTARTCVLQPSDRPALLTSSRSCVLSRLQYHCFQASIINILQLFIVSVHAV